MPDIRMGRCRLLELLGDMPQAEFARRINVSESFISKVVSGEKHLSLTKATAGALVLGCHAEDFYEWILSRPEVIEVNGSEPK